MIDLLKLEPTTITRDLKNKFILLAAPVKYGKTTFMCSIPGALILSFEPGLNAHGGVFSQRINTWSELKIVAKQLQKPEVKEKFTTVCFDTIDICAKLCQDFVCARAGVQSMGEVSFGKLYVEYENEFSKTIREIAMAGYGCIFACHTEEKSTSISEATAKSLPSGMVTKEDGNYYVNKLQPKLDKRAFGIINGLVDIIGIGVMDFDEKGEQHRYLYTSETPTVFAGNRFTYFPPKIEFSYDAVLNSLTDAIEKEGANTGTKIVDKAAVETVEKLDFKALRAEAQDLWTKLVGKGTPDNPMDEQAATEILKKIEIQMGRKAKLSEITEDQVDILNLIVMDMREMAK